MPAPDPILDAIRLLLHLDPERGRALLDEHVHLCERAAAHYAALLDAFERTIGAAGTAPQAFAEHDTARALIAADHRRFAYLAENARVFRAGLPT